MKMASNKKMKENKPTLKFNFTIEKRWPDSKFPFWHSHRALLLNDLDLNQYAEVMIDQEIDLPVLAQLNEEQLFRIGISKMGHRIRIMDSAKEAMDTYRLMDAVERANIELFGR